MGPGRKPWTEFCLRGTLSNWLQVRLAKSKQGYGPPVGFDDVELVRKATNGSDARADYKLGEILEKQSNEGNQGTTLADAIAWYRKAAAKGNEDAKNALKRLKVAETD